MSMGLNTYQPVKLPLPSEYKSKPSVVATAKEVPSGLNLTLLTRTYSLVFLLTIQALLSLLDPGKFQSASFLIPHRLSSSRSESISSSCSATPASFFMSLELRSYWTPSRERLWVMANRLTMSRCRMSYRHRFFEFPPPNTKSPFGLIDIAPRCLFLVEFLAVILSSLSLPPERSSLHSMIPMGFPVSASQISSCPLKVVDTTSFSFGWKSTYNTSELWCRVSTMPLLSKISQMRTVKSQELLASKL